MIEQTHLYREIHEQPLILRQLIEKEAGAVTELAGVINQQDITHIVIAARGTSDNVGRYAKYLLGVTTQA